MTPERAALNILLNVTREGAYLNLALKDGLSDVRTEDVGRTSRLVYTAVENLSYCDFLIENYAKGRLHSSIKCILRLALTELFFMDVPDHAACSRAVNLTEEIGKSKLKGFVNGVLRAIVRDKNLDDLPRLPDDCTKRFEILYGYPDFMINEYLRRFGAEFTEEMLKAKLTDVTVRPVYPNTADELIELLRDGGLETDRGELLSDSIVIKGLHESLSDNSLFREGKFTVQSESAMLACVCLEPRKGMRVLDACSAPGGKAAFISDLMEREGEVTAWDIHPHRVELIKSTMKRLGVTNVFAEVRDAAVSCPELNESFDRVMCDVPCSGLAGGKRPDARLRRTDESISELSMLQYKILCTCAEYLKPDGVLVYSTCTVSERENERNVERFLKEHGQFRLDSISAFLPEGMKERGKEGSLQLFPNIDGTDGFFIARFRRK